jgi:hypothetical protein
MSAGTAGVPPEVEQAISTLLEVCPRGEWGMCGLHKCVGMMTGARAGEIDAALAAMERAGVITRWGSMWTSRRE